MNNPRNYKLPSNMAHSSQNVKKIFTIFQILSKFSGMSCYCYPHEKFQTSKIGLCSAAFYSTSCIFLSVMTVRSFSVRIISEVSVVYLFGLNVITLQIILLALAEIVFNFALRKKCFETLQLFEKFDRVNNLALFRRNMLNIILF